MPLVVYLSCADENDFIVRAATEAVNNVNARLHFTAFELVYPPRRIGGDVGKVLLNVLRLREAEVVFFDITPKVSTSGDVTAYNTGVMIELGIFLDQENLPRPWGGRSPKPKFQVLCDSAFERRNLSPVLNEYSVSTYSSATGSEGALVSILEAVLDSRVMENFVPSGPKFEVSGSSSP